MILQKKKYAIIAIISAIICILAAFFIAWNKNEYYLELNIPDEEIVLEYGVDQIPEITALCKGTIFNRKGTTVETLMENTPDLTKLGTYEVTYTANYKNMSISENRTFIVADTTKPQITLVSDPEHFTSPVGTYEEEGFSAIDNYDGDITDKVTTSEKDGIITYTVTDSSGNTVSVERTIIYKDVVAPTISLADGADIQFTIGKDFADPGFSATDDVDGDITSKVTVDGSVDGHKSGTYTLTYSVVDSSDNKFEIKRTVKVGDFTAPTIQLKSLSNPYIKIESAFSDPGFTASDNVDGDITSKVKVSGSVNTNKVGTYTITYSVSDSAGNSTKQSRTIYVYQRQATSNPTNPGDKVVYLTFDDGPGPYTDTLLSILDKYGVKATFFVTNQNPNYQYMIGKIHSQGHTVALHTASHNYSNIYSSEEAYYRDLQKIHDIVVTQTGKTPTIVRFPGGTSNTVSKKYCTGIMTALSKSLAYHGYLYCDWNVSSGDAGGATTKQQVANNVISGIQKRSVSVVLQHDIKKYSVEAVDQIIGWGLANGYTFLPMTDSTPMVHFAPQN